MLPLLNDWLSLFADHCRCCSWQDNGHTGARPLAYTTVAWGIPVAEASMPIAQPGAEISDCAVVMRFRGEKITGGYELLIFLSSRSESKFSSESMPNRRAI